jgi:uncharacterized protein (TIGR03435 family)
MHKKYLSAVLVLLSASLAGALYAQGNPRAEKPHTAALVTPSERFDVISIRQAGANNVGFSIRPDPDNFSVSGATLKFIIAYAYDLHEFQIADAPGWTNSELFDIRGKVDASAAVDQSPLSLSMEQKRSLLCARLRSLLAVRFGLSIRHDFKLLRANVLVSTPSTRRKLTLASQESGYTSGPGFLKVSHFSMDDLAESLSDSTDELFLNGVGLPGFYTFTLRWRPDSDRAIDPELPGLPTALNEQLGLSLISKKQKSPVIAVLSVAQSTTN